MTDDPRATGLLRRFATLKTQRQHWESHWQEVADYIVPRKADITKKRTSGDKRSELIFDGTAIHAAELMAASLHGMLTNAATPWFSLRYESNDLNGDDEAKEWLDRRDVPASRQVKLPGADPRAIQRPGNIWDCGHLY